MTAVYNKPHKRDKFGRLHYPNVVVVVVIIIITIIMREK
jgi:hypothetical protein